MKIELVKISEVKNNPSNPRTIKDHKFKKLVTSIKEFPEMLEIRPIVVDENNIVLGGNMRLKASIEAGLKEIYIVKAKNLTEKQKKEFIIKDNVSFGNWDWDILANEYETNILNDWGLDLPILDLKDLSTTLKDKSINEKTDTIFLITIKKENYEDAEKIIKDIKKLAEKNIIELIKKQ
jgi:ParB-like chromosome segregation protein Spo0J